MPPRRPFGVLKTGSMRLLWNSLGGEPNALTSSGAKTATRTSSRTRTPPPMATLSRRRRSQAIWPSERPSILVPMPAVTASGEAEAAASVTSIGAVI